jgi:hypothetical protein
VLFFYRPIWSSCFFRTCTSFCCSPYSAARRLEKNPKTKPGAGADASDVAGSFGGVPSGVCSGELSGVPVGEKACSRFYKTVSAEIYA